MKLKLSGFTWGFTIVGFVIAVACVVLSLQYAASSEATKATITDFSTYMMIFCPPSLSMMAFETDHSLFAYVFIYTYIIVINTLLYGAIGALLRKLFKRSAQQQS